MSSDVFSPAGFTPAVFLSSGGIWHSPRCSSACRSGHCHVGGLPRIGAAGSGAWAASAAERMVSSGMARRPMPPKKLLPNRTAVGAAAGGFAPLLPCGRNARPGATHCPPPPHRSAGDSCHANNFLIERSHRSLTFFGVKRRKTPQTPESFAPCSRDGRAFCALGCRQATG